MKTATLTSNPSTDDGTFGKLVISGGGTYFTGELPWRNNVTGISCIPSGSYPCRWFNSPKHGWCYQIYNVPDRGMVEIHSANFMGDVSKGKVSQLLGCIALGTKISKMETSETSNVYQTALLQSRVAIAAFEDEMKQENFILTVVRN